MGNGSVSAELFPRYLLYATNLLNDLTRNFYVSNDLETDFEWRKNAFKLALTMQLDYYGHIGGTSTTSLNSAQSVNIGRTSMTVGTGASATNKGGIVSDDAIMTLTPTGLLYRGVCTTRW